MQPAYRESFAYQYRRKEVVHKAIAEETEWINGRPMQPIAGYGNRRRPLHSCRFHIDNLLELSVPPSLDFGIAFGGTLQPQLLPDALYQ